MLTQESRAIRKQNDAIKLEQEKKYNKAGTVYSIAKVIWQKIKNSGTKQKFCEARNKFCKTMAITEDRDDDDEYL